MLLLDDARIDARRQASLGPLRPLYASLADELEPWLGRVPYLPESKALLSRAGGRCERDGATLEFDPASPDAHRCPLCGSIHSGELHHRAWVTHYQLWLAERCVHAALFYVLQREERHRAFAADVLGRLASAYLRFPNRDNVLGPTRLFFSTYLESIWMLQICVAADLLAAAGDRGIADTVRDRIVEPSAALIAQYDEGSSNRQVWNNAALMAAAALRDDSASFETAVFGPSGLHAHLANALLPDGTWYEGENYHLFAARGLWYGVVMCETRRVELPVALTDRFQRALAAPFLTALPDFTMPARKDSQYRVSLRQWRIAELAELAFARRQDPIIGDALRRCYQPGEERRVSARARSTADIERNLPPSALTRADLGWRALLHALPELPALPEAPPSSVLLEGQGLAVFRRDERVYVALDYGQTGGGHGHPDRLNLMLSVGDTRWLDDLGTGSYLDPSLHWYRSTLAHNAPLVNGASQPRVAGQLLAHDERGAMGWIEARIELPDSDTATLTRTLVVASGYLVDELRWTSAKEIRVELPWHLDADAPGWRFDDAPFEGAGGREDGFDFVQATRRVPVAAGETIRLTASRDRASCTADLQSDNAASLFVGHGPGQPASEPRRFYVLRTEGGAGSLRAVVAWEGATITFARDRTSVEFAAGERHVHARTLDGWHVDLYAGSARSSIDLGGRHAMPAPAPPEPAEPVVPVVPVALSRTEPRGEWYGDLDARERALLHVRELGETHYRRSEESWLEAGSPSATIAIGAASDQLVIFIAVRAGEPTFAVAGASNVFDNEHPDTMAGGIQLYLRDVEEHGAWMLVPETATSAVRVRQIAGHRASRVPAARWRRREDGYEARIAVPLPPARSREYPLDLDVIVNETVTGRERRRGQLVLSGARGEFVYLRGDRHDSQRYQRFVLVE